MAFDAPRFKNPDAAREYLESVRWPDGPVCPHCGVIGEHYAMHGKSQRVGLYTCADCREQFTVTVGTVFEHSKIPLHKWVLLTELMCASKKGVSSKQVERMLGVTYKTAWFMTHRIREAMKQDGGPMLGSGGDKIVEADETFIGRKAGRKKGRPISRKETVFALVERNGNLRSFHVPDVTAKTLKAKMREHVAKEANIMTDEWSGYRGLSNEFESHDTVNHSIQEYVRDDAHTNTLEGYFSIFKRGIYGVFQHVSSHHLQRYTTEFDFRYNYREKRVKIDGKWQKTGYDDTERSIVALKGIAGKRLTYRRIGAQAL